jgi:5-methylcytosine-specific restriction endonuclease McrA
MEIISRKEALRRRLTRYFTDRPCKQGHVAERYVSTWTCVECRRASNRRECRVVNPEKKRAWNRRWRAANPDRWAAQSGLNRARLRFPGSIPPDFDFEATVPFYTEARRRTRETGIKHEVDHIHALILGGKHVAWNLQVLKRKENRKKAKAEQAEAKRRRSEVVRS